jgi:hypothetical protein
MRPGGWEVENGGVARLVVSDEGKRVRIINEQRDWAVEFVATDVPAFGYRRYKLRRVEEESLDDVDEGREIAAGGVSVVAHDDGTFDATIGGRTYTGLGALEDTGDRGDTYDYDPVAGDWKVGDVRVSRRRHANGIQELHVERLFGVPLLTEDRSARSDRNRFLRVEQVLRVVPGVERVDIAVTIDNEAPDHRLRMLFPTGESTPAFDSLTTFDVVRRTTGARDASNWIHPAPTTFPHQGWIACNGLTVAAPGLNEGEVFPDGTIAMTVLRCTGWLSRMDLRTRPSHAGPALPTPGAQCIRTTRAQLSLLPAGDVRAPRDAELGLLATHAGASPLAAPDTPLLQIEPRDIVLSAFKPADDGAGLVLRVLNPADREIDAQVMLGFDAVDATPAHLDETPASYDVTLGGRTLRFAVPAHSLRTVRLR